MAAHSQIDRLRAGGILNPEVVIEEAKREGLSLALACALLQQESGGGRNVFGHDGGTIFAGAGTVTREKYLDYKRQRDANPKRRRMQGVGATQLTWWELQDQADKEGGCWQPRYNMRIGFRHLATLMRAHGEADGIRRYNGEGAAAEAYSRSVRAKTRHWQGVLAGSRPPAPAVALKRGATGDPVVKLTRRLSFVRAAKTKQPYLDGKRTTFDAPTELALKRFQRQHGLKGTGVADADTLHKLDRSVRAEKARRRRPAPAPAPKPGQPAPRPKPARVGLAELVEHHERRAALSDRAWADLLAYGARLRQAVETEKQRPAHPVPASGNGGGADALAEALARIENKLGILIHIEQRRDDVLGGAVAASEAPAPPPPAPTIEVGVATVATAVVTATPEAVPAAPKRRALTELSHADLVQRIALLDRMSRRARAELVERYEDAESSLVALRPPKPKPRPTNDGPHPSHNGGGGVPTKPPKGEAHRRPDPDGTGGRQGGRSVVTKRGDRGMLVRRSKIALVRYLKAKGDPDTKLRTQLRRDARAPGRRDLATEVWERGVRAAQRVAGRPVDGELDGELMQILHEFWPTAGTVKRAVRSTPAWRAIPGQLTPNFNVKEFACKDGARTPYIAGLMKEQGLSKKEARMRAKGLAKRLEHLRKLGGNKPLVVTSAFRTKAYNASLSGSATNSAHTRGYAVDTPPPRGISLERHRDHARQAFECGIGYYPKGRGYFIHCDFDKTLGRRTW